MPDSTKSPSKKRSRNDDEDGENKEEEESQEAAVDDAAVTSRPWKDTSGQTSNGWLWRSPSGEQFYMEEGEEHWTNKYLFDDDVITMTFWLPDVQEDEWDTVSPAVPSAYMSNLMQQARDQQEDFRNMIATAFWDDWHGRFPPGNHWWSGKREQIEQDFAKVEIPMPASVQELLPLLSLDHIMVWDKKMADQVPHKLWIDFTVTKPGGGDSIIEEEHGLGARLDLKDGNWECVGLSYSYSAT